MANDLTPRILTSTDVQRYTRHTGDVKWMTRVEYLLGEQGPFVLELPKDEFTDTRLREEFQKKTYALSSFVK